MDWTQAFTVIGVFSAFFIYIITKMDNKFSHVDEKFENLGNRIGKVENRLTSLEAEIKNVNQRVDSINQRITDLRTDINQRLSTIEGYLIPKKIYRIEEPPQEEPKEN